MRQQTVMIAAAVAMVAGVSLMAATHQTGQEPFTLSAVVLDKSGAPVRNLTAADFTVTENGRQVPVAGFGATTIGESATRGRAIALVLGAAGTDPELTSRVQSVSRGFIETAATNDRVSVVRYSRHDELAGDRSAMLMRVAEYRADMGEPLNGHTQRDVLDLVAKLSKDLLTVDASRRAIVFVGAPAIFDVQEPAQRQYELEWPYWVSALTASARANVSVYIIDPNGLRGAGRINPDGLVAQTGGAVFENRNDLLRTPDLVWRDTGSYYALEYLTGPSKGELQDIRVRVNRPDVTIRARRSR